VGLTNQLRKKGVAEKTREMSRGRQAGIPEGELVKRRLERCLGVGRQAYLKANW